MIPNKDNLRQRKPKVDGDYKPVDVEDPDEKLKATPKSIERMKLGKSFQGKDANFYIVVGFLVLGLFVRLFRISQPAEVVFDEVHFGGFARKYIKGLFFMDVHPPLGKLLFAAIGILFGFDGNFEFKSIGDDYTEVNVPYIAMRMLPGVLSALLVPISYVTMRNFGATQTASIISASLLLFENALTTQSRLILLDSALIFFTGLTIMTWSDFLACQNAPFTFPWWYSLAMTGVGLGLSVSVKWVGLFVIAAVGLSTIHNLWSIIGDLTVTPRVFIRHFAARALFLIVLPISIYMAMFQIHFLALPNKGSGSSFMSAEFQSTLRGAEIPDAYLNVAFGSKIRIRHDRTAGGFLHSHNHTYKTGSKQQQVTLYPFRDENNWWIVLPALPTGNATFTEDKLMPKNFTKVKDGDIIRLQHVSSKKKLHSHDVRPPVTEKKQHSEVSGYGGDDFPGDTNDHWKVELVDRVGNAPHLKAFKTRLRLIHVNTGRALFSHKVKLPSWAFEQQEVTAAENGRQHLTHWRIEGNEHVNMPPGSKRTNYQKPGFLEKFLELQQVMWNVNQGLTKSHPYESRPPSWPILNKGISFWTHKKGGATQIYLLGNPLVWWGALACIGIYGVYFVINALLTKRKITANWKVDTEKAANGGGFLVIAWGLHYFPFFLMERQLFLHHYLPALYFSILLIGVIFDVITIKFNPYVRLILASILIISTLWVFTDFAPLAYGSEMTTERCKSIKWSRKWNFDCNRASKAPKTTSAKA